jgi:hypothetical protein
VEGLAHLGLERGAACLKEEICLPIWVSAQR